MGWLTGIEPATPGATILSQIKETQQSEGGFSELETAPETTVFSEWMAPFLGVEQAPNRLPVPFQQLDAFVVEHDVVERP